MSNLDGPLHQSQPRTPSSSLTPRRPQVLGPCTLIWPYTLVPRPHISLYAHTYPLKESLFKGPPQILGNLHMVDSQNKGNPTIDPKIYSPYYGDPQNGTPQILGNLHISVCEILKLKLFLFQQSSVEGVDKELGELGLGFEV